MISIKETANKFFADCESGKGWQTCKDYCSANATFSSHATSLEGLDTVEAYADWMKGVCQMLPDCSYELKATTVDEEAGYISFFAVFSGTHTGEGGPVPPTGKRGEVDYVYALEFSGGKILHLTKIWNPHHFNQQVGWE